MGLDRTQPGCWYHLQCAVFQHQLFGNCAEYRPLRLDTSIHEHALCAGSEEEGIPHEISHGTRWIRCSQLPSTLPLQIGDLLFQADQFGLVEIVVKPAACVCLVQAIQFCLDPGELSIETFALTLHACKFVSFLLAAKPFHEPAQRWVDPDGTEYAQDLMLEDFHPDRWLAAPAALLRAPVVGVVPGHSIRNDPFALGLGGDEATTLTARDQAGEGEDLPLRAWSSLGAEQSLDLVVLVERDHRLMLTVIRLAVETKVARVEQVLEQLVDSVGPERMSQSGHEASTIDDDRDLARVVHPSECEVPDATCSVPANGIDEDLSVTLKTSRIVEIADRCNGRKPTVVDFGGHATPAGLREISDELVGHTSVDTEDQGVVGRIVGSLARDDGLCDSALQKPGDSR